MEAAARELLALESQRATAFSKLTAAHKVYLDTEGGFEPYKAAVAEATNAFKIISEKVMALQKRLQEENPSSDLTSLVGKVQVLEEQLLKFTVDHQLALELARQSPNDDLLARNAKGAKKALDAILDELVDVLSDVRVELADLEEDGQR